VKTERQAEEEVRRRAEVKREADTTMKAGFKESLRNPDVGNPVAWSPKYHGTK